MHTVDAKEIENFAKDSAYWWDEAGPFAPLHRLNPVRLQYIKDQICGNYGLDAASLRPYAGLSILDIGCGGGLVCEPMARLGADVTGIDADNNAIDVARAHADEAGLDIRYIACSTEDLLGGKTPPSLATLPSPRLRGDKRGERAHGAAFDVVLALEIVEHVSDVDEFVRHCVELCKPDGIIVFSTLNRTMKSFVLGKMAAEYILGWVPKGTHDWKKFLKPSELAQAVRYADAHVINTEGLVFDPIAGSFKRSLSDYSINYFLTSKMGEP